MTNNDFRPTHRITFTRPNGAITTYDVMLDDDGPAYTREEWDASEAADWTCVDGEWLCQGQATPGGANGTVEVEEIEPEDEPITHWSCQDSGGDPTEIEADDAESAAQEYVDGGDWGDQPKTQWVDVYCSPIVNGAPDRTAQERVTVEIDPTEPDCTESDHDWQSPISVVGGIESNPGVYGHGGGVTITEVCRHCGAYKVTDTWAQNPSTGEQGLHSVEYREADDASRAWVEEQAGEQPED